MMRLRPLLPALLLSALLPLTAWAQQSALAFDGLKTDPKAQVQVAADQLQINQADGSATFSGHVVVTQGPMELQAGAVTVVYGATQNQIAELRATGGITLKSGSQAVSADSAVYTVDGSQLVLTGNVLVSNPAATLSGQTLTINLATGLGTMSGRVTTSFTPGGN